MLRKYSILLSLIISIVLLVIATLYYPGGSQLDKNSIGYDWANNYLSNLFGEKAVNGAHNPSQFWAVFGMLFLCVSFALFFIEFSKKISSKSSARIIRYCGVSAMIFAFLAVTPYHDTMIMITSTLALVSIFYITIYVFKSRKHLLKFLCILCLLILYCCNYVYYTRNYLEFLPIMQKTSLFITISWVLCLQYFSKKEDFQHIK
ncbi:MAG: hypothetical protein JWQ25_1270 [Daejeonella sp.]|nr:hypothetical protein [Daejeonella sp.]